LGTWDLLCGWTRQPSERVEPRLALQLVHEAALCLTGLRRNRGLRQRGFEIASGLPFLASDVAIHQLLNAHTVNEAKNLQIALGKLRRASGHFQNRVLVVDPHRIPSHSKRQMRRHKHDQKTRAIKMAQTFFCLDADTKQPLGFVIGTAARTATQATPELLELTAAIGPPDAPALVLADCEHFSTELIDQIHSDTRYDLLVPIPQRKDMLRRIRALPDERFARRWAGYATAKLPYQLTHSQQSFWQFVQRFGERPDDYRYNSFLCTRDTDEAELLTADYPKRWHIEEFFNNEQDLGWKRAGTQNLHIRYGHMSMALIAQAVLYQFRQRLGEPESQWDSRSIAEKVLSGLEGDIRVHDDTITVTFYNAPNAERLAEAYTHLPAKLSSENVDPRIPWLYGFKLDFRFR
jgi:hypothetical protein